MKKISECKMCRALSQWCASLFKYSVQKDYTMSLALYADENAEIPECSHEFKGSSRHNLFRILAVFGILCLAFSLIRGLCSLFSEL